MKTTCIMCGRPQEINSLHKDYKRLAKEGTIVFVCYFCSEKTVRQACRDKHIPIYFGWRKE